MALRVLLSGGLADGGVRTHIRLLTTALRSRGISVTIASVATNWPAADLEALGDCGARVHTTRWGFGRSSAIGKAQAILTWPFLLDSQYDVVLCIGYGRMHRFVQRTRGSGAAVLFHEVVDAPSASSPATAMVRRMSGIIASSGPVAERWRSLAPRLPIRIIPFLTLSGLPVRCRRERRSGSELRAVYLGRIVRHKRVDWLVNEWKEIERRVGSIRLDVHGADYPGERLLASLRENVRREGLDDRVTLHGPYGTSEELASILSAADVVLLPSLYEGLPLVLVEAMAAGVPIVATDAGGTADLARDNPDVEVTGTSELAFVEGLERLVGRIRAGQLDPARLAAWTKARYGREVVEQQWVDALQGCKQWARMPSQRSTGG